MLDGVVAGYISYAPDLAIPGATDSIRAFVEHAVEHGIRDRRYGRVGRPVMTSAAGMVTALLFTLGILAERRYVMSRLTGV